MKKILIIVISVFVFMIIVVACFFHYKTLYDKQLSARITYLERHVELAGHFTDSINRNFSKDIKQIILTDDVLCFFTGDEACRTRTVDRMKLFFIRYSDFVTGIKLYDNNRNEFSLKSDETGINWLEHNFVLHEQDEIILEEKLMKQGRVYSWVIPVIHKDKPFGNIVVNIDYLKFFSNLFDESLLSHYQWQWVMSPEGDVIFSNRKGGLKYSSINKLTEALEKGERETLMHSAEVDGKPFGVISSTYPVNLLQRNLCFVFSSSAEGLMKYIIENTLPVVFGSSVMMIILLFFVSQIIRELKKEIESRELLWNTILKMVEEFHAAVVIYNGDREIIRANNKAAEQFGYASADDMKGEIYPEPAFIDESNYFSKYLGGSFNREQFVILKKDREEIILFRTSMPVTLGKGNSTMDMLVDVTMLETARKQEASASTAKSEFLARMSYEIRTPLNGIIGLTDILEKQELTNEARNVLGLLRRSGEVLLNIINDILDFSKIESGRMILDEIPFSLREEVVYCYDLARTNINESRVTMTCNVEENVPDKVIGDPYRLRQILTNLLNHSAENTSEGKISLVCRLLENSGETLKLGFELTDTGKSFDRESLKKIFGDNISVESKVHQDDDDSGFSTILARKLVGLMGGEFSAVSPSGLDDDKGVRVSFSITLYPNCKPSKNLNFDNISSFGNIRTLVITGSQTRDEDILGSLHKLGLALTVTTYHKSTINQIRENLKHKGKRYQLLVILDDIEFDGFPVAGEINDNGLSGEFIIMMISSNDVMGNLRKCILSGVDHYIIKPYELKEVYETIKTSFPQVDKSVPAPTNEKVRRDLRILVVEDNKMNQKVIGTMLKSLGYSFDFADDGYAGYIQAKTRHYDVIFMDLIMPEMDGFESARKILEFDNSILIVAFTADSMPESKKKAEMSGIKEFIPKPVRIDDLKKFFTSHFINN
ncbi:MAG: response regulator [Bacteroidota bacterium]|nr:response regulator [Bacteroidota bacterium]